MNSVPLPTIKTEQERANWVSILLIGAAILLAVAAAYIWFFQPGGLTITWTTENELDTIGYNVYRSDSADGEYVKLTESVMPAFTDATLGGEHEFVDKTVERGKIYFYKLETVGRQGESEFEGPIELKAR